MKHTFQTKISIPGELDYSVAEYTEQLRLCWQETKRDFLQLVNWRKSTTLPTSEEIYEKTVAWEDFFKAIQEEFTFDDSCFNVRLGNEPHGNVAAALLDFRYTYGFNFELLFIETEYRLEQLFKELAEMLISLEYRIEKHLPGVTRKSNSRPVKMLKSTTYEELLRELKIAYLDPLTRGSAWMIACSFGKDSTLTVKAVVEMLEKLPEEKRIRDVFVCYSDTGMEAPVVYSHIMENALEIAEYAKAKRLPLEVHRVEPEIGQRFFSLMVGYGYLPPSRLLRWCTSRLKLNPNGKKIEELCHKYQRIIVILGTRQSESATRKASIIKHSDGEHRYKEKEITQLIYQPIRYFSTETVWKSLERGGGLPWGTGYARLFRLYKDSSGECPLVALDSSTPTCAGNGGRWGCWTCSLVKDDKSMRHFIENGYTWMLPLYNFRNFIIALAKDPSMREPYMMSRKTGKILKTGTLGGFNKKARRILFSELMKLRDLIARTKPDDIDFQVISDAEIEQIQQYWRHLDNLVPWAKEETQEQLSFAAL